MPVFSRGRSETRPYPRPAGALALIVAVLLLAAFLRFHELGVQSFWNDEGNSARIVERTPALIVEAAAGDIHPPLYYLLLAGWRLLTGFSEFALRSFSALCGLATVALTFALGRRLFDAAVGVLGALIVALHAFQVTYSQEARMYALMAALAAGSMYAFIRWLDFPKAWGRGGSQARPYAAHLLRGDSSDKPQWAAAWALLNAAGMYTQYAYPVVVLAQAILFLAWWLRESRSRALVARFAVLIVAPVALYLPWAPIAARQVTGWPTAGAGTSFFEALRQLAALLIYGVDVRTWGLGRAIWAAGLPLVAAAAPVLAPGVSVELHERTLQKPAWKLGMLWLWAALPIAGMFALGLYRPAFLKTLLIGHAPVALLIAWGLAAMARASRLTALLALVCLAGITAQLAVGLNHVYNDPAQARADYRAMAARIEADARPGDAVLLNAANQWEVFTYYHREDVPGNAPVYPIPRTRPADAEAVRAELDGILAAHDRLFVLYWGDAESDPARVVESYLNERAFAVSSEWYKDVRFVVYAVPPAVSETPATRLEARFGEAIRLTGYTLAAPDPLRPGDVITLTLFWEADVSIRERYKVFVHLADAGEMVVAQHDSEPVGDLRPTSTWSPGETIIDHHGLLAPQDAPPGEYQLRVGLYAVDDPTARLPVYVDGEAAGDSLRAGEVHMR